MIPIPRSRITAVLACHNRRAKTLACLDSLARQDLAADIRIGAEYDQVRTGDGAHAFGHVLDPRDGAAVIEAKRHVHAHAHAPMHASNNPNDVGVFSAGRHEVGHRHLAVNGLPRLLNNQRIGQVPPRA